MEYVKVSEKHGYEYTHGDVRHRVLAPLDVPKEQILKSAERALWFQSQEDRT